MDSVMLSGSKTDDGERMTDRNTLDLKRYIPALLSIASNKLSHGASEKYRRLFGIGISEWRVISNLAIEPGIPASRLCQLIGFDKALASRTIQKLTSQGIVAVTPDESHGSRSLIELTAEGWALHDRILQVVVDREEILHSAFSRAEIDTLVLLLQRIAEQADVVNAHEPDCSHQSSEA